MKVSAPFVMPKVGDTVWYYFEHAFWDVPLEDLGGLKRWRFTGRTELRSRVARILDVTDSNGSRVILAPEYNSEDRIRRHNFGVFAGLALARVSAYIHTHAHAYAPWTGIGYVYGRIVDGMLPEDNHWGYDPLPAVGGGR